jgi:ubiquinone/menaquinone biosynthesis C-methylase UbiE
LEPLLDGLGTNQIAVDLGCGRGSFHYGSRKCRIIGVDVALPSTELYRDDSRIDYVRADSGYIPFASDSVDAVLCHHTMEHFPDYERALKDIDRVLKDRGLLWIAIPNGYGFDDSLYRLVFSGGGHVNRFTHDGLIDAVHRLTRLRLKQEVDLFSSFVYLKKPSPEEYEHFPPSARPLFHLPDGFSTAGVLALNAVTRVADKIFGSRISQYGWGFVFASENAVLPPLHTAYFNVCSRCGSGLPAAELRKRDTTRTVLGLGMYHCPNCAQINSFVEPPPGLA